MLWTYCSFLSVQNIQVNTIVFGYSSVDEGKRRHTLYKTILFYAHLKISNNTKTMAAETTILPQLWL